MYKDSRELQKVLDALMHPELKTIDLSLDRVHKYLAHCGHPEKKLPPIIHVAGTNGKGSTIAFLRAALEEAGYKCHVYTSPHLVSFTERIVLAGNPVSESELLPILEAIQDDYAHFPLTFFEATTVAAFQLFAKHDADVVLLEVGMGGQFDATNVVDPIVTVITPIGIDHQEFLGNTLAKIAYEKACIMKAGVPCVSAPQEEEVVSVITDKAQELSTPLQYVKSPFSGDMGLEGAYQRINAAVAAKVIDLVKSEIPVSDLQRQMGFAQATWPARLQKIDLPVGARCQAYLDGGHNIHSAMQLKHWLQERGKPVHLLCAMVRGKDHQAFLSALSPYVDSITVTNIEDEPLGEPKESLYTIAKELHENVFAVDSSEEAFATIKDMAEETILLCCGSLYFAGKMLEKFPQTQ